MSHVYKFLLTNARSLSPKIHSLHTAFLEPELDFALITELWLTYGHVLDNDVIDLEWGTNLKILYKKTGPVIWLAAARLVAVFLLYGTSLGAT